MIYSKEDREIVENPDNAYQLVYGLNNPSKENLAERIKSKISICDTIYLPIIDKHISNKSTKTVLEFGSGLGVMANYLSPLFKNYICIDVNEHYLSECKKYSGNNSNIEYFLLDDYNFNNIKIDNKSIDIIKSTNVFIHLNIYEFIIYVKKFYSLLKDEGILLFDIYDSDQISWDSKPFREHIENYKKQGNFTFTFKPISSSTVIKELSKMGFEVIYEFKNGEGACTLGFKKLTKIL